MKLKLDDKGNAVLQDGKPVYVHPDGTEVPFDAPAALTKITTLSAEAKNHRLAAQAATEKLTAFEGIADPAAALKALQFAASMDGKKVMDDEGLQKLLGSAVKPVQEQLAAALKTVAERDASIYGLQIGSQFANSQYLKEKTVLIPDIAEAYFGKHLKIENGKVLATDSLGNQIFSKITPGEPAGFEEALAVLIENHPQKTHLLRASGSSGSGSQQSNGTGGQKTMPLTQFNELSPVARSQYMAGGGTLTD